MTWSGGGGEVQWADSGDGPRDGDGDGVALAPTTASSGPMSDVEVVDGAPGARRVGGRRQLTLVAAVAAFVAMLTVLASVVAGFPLSSGPEAITTPGADLAGAAITTSSGAPTSRSGAPTTTGGPTVEAAAPSSTPTTSGVAAPGSIRDADLRTFAYPASVCPYVVATDGTIVFRDGVAGVSEATFSYDDPATYGHGADIDSIGFGDVTGDGVEDALVHFRCAYFPGERDDDALAVVSATAAGIAVVGVLDEAGVTHSVTDVYGTRDVTYDVATASRAEGGALVIDWLDHHFGARFSTTVRYAFDGAGFVARSDTGLVDLAPEIGPAPAPATGDEGRSIERHDVDSLALPLSDGNVCGPQFADLGPLLDARFDPDRTFFDGVTNLRYVDVLTADGLATDAKVWAGSATWKEVTASDGAHQIELIISLGCQRGDTTTWGLLVLRDAPTGPEAIGWVFGPPPVSGAIHASVTLADWLDGDLVVEWRDASGTVVDVHRLRWDGAAFFDIVTRNYCHL